MNVVYIHAHDLGRYCEPMGYPIPAPNLLKFAKQGTLFRNAFSSAPTCAPSTAKRFAVASPIGNGNSGGFFSSRYLYCF